MPSAEAIALMARAAQKQLDAAIKRAEEVSAMTPDPSDDFEDGAVIQWNTRYAGAHPTYTYVALKTFQDNWYVTGNAHSNVKYTWQGILSLMKYRIGSVEVCTEWQEVEGL